MILKRIRKVEYNEKGEPIIRIVEHHLYDIRFIDNEDWLCIDEEDYTPSKKAARDEERRKHLMKRYAVVDYSRLPKPIGRVFYSTYIDESLKMTQTIDEMITIKK